MVEESTDTTGTAATPVTGNDLLTPDSPPADAPGAEESIPSAPASTRRIRRGTRQEPISQRQKRVRNHDHNADMAERFVLVPNTWLYGRLRLPTATRGDIAAIGFDATVLQKQGLIRPEIPPKVIGQQ